MGEAINWVGGETFLPKEILLATPSTGEPSPQSKRTATSTRPTLFDCNGSELASIALTEFGQSFFQYRAADSSTLAPAPSWNSDKRCLEGDWWSAALTDRLQVNASVSWTGEKPLFAMTSGMILAIIDASRTVVAHPRFLSDLVPFAGAIQTQSAPRPIARYSDYRLHGTPDTQSPLGVFDANPYSWDITDSRRQELVYWLFEAAVKFIASHEVGHWLSGHVTSGLRLTLDGTNETANTMHAAGDQHQQDDSVPPHVLRRRRMELQADTVAVQLLMNRSLFRMRAGPPDAFAAPKLEVWERFAATGIALVLSILTHHERRVRGIGNSSLYPSAAIRALNVLKHIVHASCHSSKYIVMSDGSQGVQATLGDLAHKVLVDILTVFDALEVKPFTEADLEVSVLSTSEPKALTPNIKEMFELQRGIPPLRTSMRSDIIRALTYMQSRLPSDMKTTSRNSPLALCDDLASLSSMQFYYELMKCCADNGTHIPWSSLGKDEFVNDCISRSLPSFQKRFPQLSKALATK